MNEGLQILNFIFLIICKLKYIVYTFSEVLFNSKVFRNDWAFNVG